MLSSHRKISAIQKAWPVHSWAACARYMFPNSRHSAEAKSWCKGLSSPTWMK
jgi:hypothetical protein